MTVIRFRTPRRQCRRTATPQERYHVKASWANVIDVVMDIVAIDVDEAERFMTMVEICLDVTQQCLSQEDKNTLIKVVGDSYSAYKGGKAR